MRPACGARPPTHHRPCIPNPPPPLALPNTMAGSPARATPASSRRSASTAPSATARSSVARPGGRDARSRNFSSSSSSWSLRSGGQTQAWDVWAAGPGGGGRVSGGAGTVAEVRVRPDAGAARGVKAGASVHTGSAPASAAAAAAGGGGAGTVCLTERAAGGGCRPWASRLPADGLGADTRAMTGDRCGGAGGAAGRGDGGLGRAI